VNDLRASTNQLQWGDITKASMAGGGDNLFAGEVLGKYRDMLLIESTRIPTFSNYGAGANIKAARALFLGAQAAVVAHGKDTDEWGKLKLAEKEFDYGKRYGVGVTMIWGIQKSTFNGQDDFGVFAIDTAAQQHN
jgi:N4-gp56 family major capsid protein